MRRCARHFGTVTWRFSVVLFALSSSVPAQDTKRWSEPDVLIARMLTREPLDPVITRQVVSLLSEIKVGHPKNRLRAEVALISLGPKALAPLKYLSDDDDVRRIMSQFGPAAIPELLKLNAQDVLVAMGPSNIPAIIDAWEKKEPSSATPFVALATFGRVATPALVGLLTHPNPEIRVYAAQVFALHPDPDAADALIASLTDESRGVRIQSARSLNALGDRRAIPYLLPWLDDPAPIVREEALAGLGAMYEPKFRGYLARAARWDQDVHTRNSAASILSRIDSPIERRLAKRYKPLTFDPAQELAAAVGRDMFFLFTIGVFLAVSVPLGFRMRTEGQLITKGTSALWAGLVLLGFYWGFGLNHTSGREELICCFLLIPFATWLGTGFGLAARGSSSLYRLALIRRSSTALAAAWLGYGVGQGALWGYLGF